VASFAAGAGQDRLPSAIFQRSLPLEIEDYTGLNQKSVTAQQNERRPSLVMNVDMKAMNAKDVQQSLPTI